MGTAGTVLAILASSVVVLGGLVALVRAIWVLAQTIRDSVRATKDLTVKFQQFTPAVDGRLTSIELKLAQQEQRITDVEHRSEQHERFD